MHKKAKYLVGTAGIVLCLAAAFALVHHASLTAPTPAQNPPSVLVQNAPPTSVLPTASPANQSAVPVASNTEIAIPPLPADAISVPDEDLLKLSAMVNLPNAEERRIDKEQWSRALPVAQRLAQGPCDCEQRNWLTQFIKMGTDALADSNEDYYRLAAVMRKTARNDKQLTNDPAFFAR